MEGNMDVPATAEAHIDVPAIANALKDCANKARERSEGKRHLKEVRLQSLNPQRPAEEELAKLDSAIKKNGALAKKLRVLSDTTLDAALKDIQSVNQTKFLSEATSALLEAATKPGRVPCILKVILSMHARYEAFKDELADGLKKAFEHAVPTGDNAAVLQRRAILKLAVDLELSGILSTTAMLKGVLEQLANTSFRLEDGTPVAALAQLTTFVRMAREDVLLRPLDAHARLPEGSPEVDELTTSDNEELAQLSGDVLNAMSELDAAMESRYRVKDSVAAPLIASVNKAFHRASDVLVQMHNNICDMEVKNNRVLVSRGALPSSMQEKSALKHQIYKEYRDAFEAFAVAWGCDVPALKETNPAELNEGGLVTVVQLGAGDGELHSSIWEDEQSAMFYESLPDLEGVVPSMALARGRGETADEQAADDVPQSEKEAGGGAVSGEGDQEAAKGRASGGFAGGDVAGKHAGDSAAEGEGETGGTGQDEDTQDCNLEALRGILEQLPLCVSADKADDLAINFCFIQTKGKRKALARTLGNLYKLQLQLLPFYARITAVLNQVFPDIGNTVGDLAVKAFKDATRSKDATQRTIEPRIRAARYLAELAKFRVIDPGEFFLCLKRCLDDFTGNNIDTACELVTGAGAFMFRQQATRERMQSMLSIMERQRGSRNLDYGKALMIDGASYACRPAPPSTLKERSRTPLQRYIRHLLFDAIAVAGKSEEQVVKHMRRLPWSECEGYVLKCTLQAAVRGQYTHIHEVASLMAHLGRHRPSLVTGLVDTLLEDMQEDMLAPSPEAKQRRIAHARLFAELYNFQVIRHQLLFFVLYQLISFGLENPEAAVKLDPPDDYTRLRLVCTMLITCGHYFARGQTKQKLERFLIFLQRYVLSKEDLSMEIRIDFRDLMNKLQPKATLYTTFEEADAAVTEYVKEEMGRMGDAAAASHMQNAAQPGESGVGHQSDMHGGSEGDTDEEADAHAQTSVDLEHEAENSSVVLNDEWMIEQEKQVDELFEKELAAVLPSQPVKSIMLPPPGAPTRAAEQHGDSKPVAFRVRIKRQGARGDDDSRQVTMPSTSAIVSQLRVQRAHEDEERSEMKKLVLAAERSQFAEEHGLSQSGGARGTTGRKSYLAERNRGRDAGIRMGEASFTSELRNVRGAL